MIKLLAYQPTKSTKNFVVDIWMDLSCVKLANQAHGHEGLGCACLDLRQTPRVRPMAHRPML